MPCRCRYCNEIVSLKGHDCPKKFACKDRDLWPIKAIRKYGKRKNKKI
jgi:hypothetical protein